MTTRENRRRSVAPLTPVAFVPAPPPARRTRSRTALGRDPAQDAATFTPRTTAERREEARESCSDPVWWRCERAREARVGWLLERSPGGAAFVMRDDLPPLKGSAVEIFTWLPGSAGGRRGRLGFVRRVEQVHDNLYLVAVQLFRYRTSAQDGSQSLTVRTTEVEPYERHTKTGGRVASEPAVGEVSVEPKVRESHPRSASKANAPSLKFVPAPEGWAD